MCNSLPPRAALLQRVDDAPSVVEGPRPRGEHDCNVFLTLTPLAGPWRGPWRSQVLPNITHAQPSAYWPQTREASAFRREEKGKQGGGRHRAKTLEVTFCHEPAHEFQPHR